LLLTFNSHAPGAPREPLLRRPGWMLLFCAVATAYFAAAFWLKTTYDPVIISPDIAGKKILLRRPFTKYDDSKFAVLAPDHWFTAFADSGDDPTGSEVLLFEDDKPLGPSHWTPHEEIATKGMGRYSHWKNIGSVFVFSSTDNTDPNTNGRAYWAVGPEGTKPKVSPLPEEEVYAIPDGKLVIQMRKPFETFAGSHMAVAHALDALTEFADDRNNEKQRSPIVLYEDDRALGPAHSTHTDIAALGEGRYSHWKTQGMVFSTSDNSDPNTNGRRYWAVLPEETQ
jgi:hypothetical protein